MIAGAVLSVGGNQSHNNMQPYLAVNYIIALSGVFPSDRKCRHREEASGTLFPARNTEVP